MPSLSRRTLLWTAAGAPLLALANAVAIDPAKALGSKTAPLVFELFTDFECPACRGFHHDAIRPMVSDYVNRGKVYLAWRDFPLPMHKHSREAAWLATAASRIGKFEAVSNLLYEKQQAWSANGDLTNVLRFALPPGEFHKIVELSKTPAVRQSVDADWNEGVARGINQTPTSILTRRMRTFPPIRGSVNYSILRRFLDEQLKG
jgi:protein-disulfide isomerase